MEFFGKILGGESPSEVPKPEEEVSKEAQKTLELVRETLGELGDTFLRHSQGQLVQSLDDDLTRTVINTLLTSVKEYREGIEPESLKAKAVKTAEAQFYSVIGGADEEETLKELHDLAMTPPPSKGELTRHVITSPEEPVIEKLRLRINNQIQSLSIVAKESFKLPDEDLVHLEEMQTLIFDSSFDDPELLESFQDYCTKLTAAMTYAVSMELSQSMVFESTDVIQEFLEVSNEMQQILTLAEVKSGERPVSEILAQVAGVFVLRHFLGPEAETFVEMGADPKKVARFLSEHPEAGKEAVEVLTPIVKVLGHVESPMEIMGVTGEILNFGVHLKELLASKESRATGVFAFDLFIKKLEGVEGLVHGKGFVKEGGIDELHAKNDDDGDFSKLIKCETKGGPVQVPWGFVKDFSRSIHSVNGKPFRSKMKLQEVKNLEECPELVGFLNACLDNGLSREDLEAILISSFQGVIVDLAEHSTWITSISGVLINTALEGAKSEAISEYCYNFDEDGTLRMTVNDRNFKYTIEGLIFGTAGLLTVNFGQKDDGSVDYTKGSTESEFSTLAEINEPMTPEEFEEI